MYKSPDLNQIQEVNVSQHGNDYRRKRTLSKHQSHGIHSDFPISRLLRNILIDHFVEEVQLRAACSLLWPKHKEITALSSMEKKLGGYLSAL